MNALEANTALISYLRFKKQMSYVCTEIDTLNGARADVLASNGTDLIEFEVKTNVADVRADLKKFEKHAIYGNVGEIVQRDENSLVKGKLLGMVEERYKGHWTYRVIWAENEESVKAQKYWDSGISYFYAGHGGYKTHESAMEHLRKKLDKKKGIPNQLIYVVKEDVAEKAAEIIPKEYGIWSFKDYQYANVRSVRKAKKLHSNPVSPEMLSSMVHRMASEIANFHIHLVGKSLYEQIREACERSDKDLLAQNEAE